jgi:DNA-directed RNA polymerase I, II, and III subunit RPABC2
LGATVVLIFCSVGGDDYGAEMPEEDADDFEPDEDQEGGEVEVLPDTEGTEAGATAKKSTTPFMTKYERARVLGTRALQIR